MVGSIVSHGVIVVVRCKSFVYCSEDPRVQAMVGITRKSVRESHDHKYSWDIVAIVIMGVEYNKGNCPSNPI